MPEFANLRRLAEASIAEHQSADRPPCLVDRALLAALDYRKAADLELHAIRQRLVRANIIDPELMMLAGEVKVARDELQALDEEAGDA